MCWTTIVIHLTVMNMHTCTFTHSGISCICKMTIADWFSDTNIMLPFLQRHPPEVGTIKGKIDKLDTSTQNCFLLWISNLA